MAFKFTKFPPPPNLLLEEFLETEFDALSEALESRQDIHQRIRKRFGVLTEWLDLLYTATASGDCDCCTPFRWIYTIEATVDDTGFGAQTNFTLPLPYELEDSIYHLVFARSSFQYYVADYTINAATNTLTFPAGLALGEYMTIYAVKHDDVQRIIYETVAVAAVPYLFSPDVTVDRAAGRQLVFARHSPRFFNSGRPGDEFSVSNTANTISLSSGLGGVGEQSCVVRLRECGCYFHEEILATVAGQTVFSIANLDHVIQPHASKKLIVFQRVSFLHPEVEYTTDPVANLITIDGPGLDVGQALNIFCYR